LPKMIYPGVYVLDTPQTEAFQSSRASKYLTSYTESRYENWQLALKQAELAYKMDYDAYTSRDKALRDLEEAARKDLTSAERTLLSLQKEDRATEDKERAIKASRTTEHDKWKASEVGKDRRTNVMAGAPKSMGPGGEKVAAQTVDALFKNAQSETDIEEASKELLGLILDDTSDAQGFRSATAQRTGVAEDRIGAYIAKEAATLAAKKREKLGLPPSAGKGYEKDLAALGASYAPGVASSGRSGGSRGSYDPTSPEFVDRSEAIKAAEADIAAKKASYAEALLARTGLSMPKPNLVESARDIYASQFETLPGYLKHKEDLRSVEAQRRAHENTAALVELFVEDRKKKLGESPSMEDLLAAKTEGAKDALFFLKHKELRGKAQNLNTPILEAGKVVGFKPAGFDIEAPMQDEKESLWDYIDGAKKGQPIPEGLRGPLEGLVSAPGSAPSPGARTDSSPISGDPEEDYDLGDTDATIKLPPSVRIEQMKALKSALGNLDVVDPATKPISESELDAFQFGKGGGVLPPAPATVKIEKRPDAELVMEEIKNKGPKVQEGRAISAQIKDSHELSKQPKKVERLASTTSYGKYVKDLYVANKASTTPQNGAQLREQVLQNLPEGEREAASRLLFALILLDK